jgi:hypothetical protein
MVLLILKDLMMLRPEEALVVAVSILELEPRATKMISGLFFDVMMVRVLCPEFDIPVIITLLVPTVPAVAS